MRPVGSSTMTEYNCEWQHFGSRFYSQFGEDIIILNIFIRMNIDRPSYLDLGAHHPFHISNTALMYERGSRGINVEPNPDLINAFEIMRPSDINLCAGVAPKNGILKFYRCASLLGSGKNSFIKTLSEEQGRSIAMDVPVYTVTEIVERHADGIFPDFLSVDVEGMDYDILESIDFDKSFPKVICVEMFSGAKGQLDSAPKIKNLLKDRYFLHSQAGANGIFVHWAYEYVRK